MNKEGYDDFADVLARSDQALSPEAFEIAANETEAVVLDVRHQDEFAKGHIPRSIFIGLAGGFAPWVGALIADIKQPILLITAEGKEEEAITRLSRVGFDQVLGYLKGGFDAWKKASKDYDTISSITAATFKEAKDKKEIPVFDVRKEGEFLSEHVLEAHNTPLNYLNNHLTTFPDKETFYVYCAGGYRSMIAASMLKNRGIHNFIDVAGGFDIIKNTEIAMSDFACPSTL